MRRVGALRIAPAGSCHRVSTRVRDMSEITTREYRYVNRYVNLFFARPVDPARAHVTSVAARDRGQSSYESYHLRDTSSKVSVYLSREFAEKKFIWRTRPRPTGGGDTRFLNWEI